MELVGIPYVEHLGINWFIIRDIIIPTITNTITATIAMPNALIQPVANPFLKT